MTLLVVLARLTRTVTCDLAQDARGADAHVVQIGTI
jgi:hypothetical protein